MSLARCLLLLLPLFGCTACATVSVKHMGERKLYVSMQSPDGTPRYSGPGPYQVLRGPDQSLAFPVDLDQSHIPAGGIQWSGNGTHRGFVYYSPQTLAQMVKTTNSASVKDGAGRPIVAITASHWASGFNGAEPVQGERYFPSGSPPPAIDARQADLPSPLQHVLPTPFSLAAQEGVVCTVAGQEYRFVPDTCFASARSRSAMAEAGRVLLFVPALAFDVVTSPLLLGWHVQALSNDQELTDWR